VAMNFMKSEGISQIFSNYQSTPVEVRRAIARSAALTGVQTHKFFQALDQNKTHHMDNAAMFEYLKHVLGENELTDTEAVQSIHLTDAQIASVVRDVVFYANQNKDKDDPVAINEFTLLTGDDSCGMRTLLDIYQDDPGDEDMLKRILSEGQERGSNGVHNGKKKQPDTIHLNPVQSFEIGAGPPSPRGPTNTFKKPPSPRSNPKTNRPNETQKPANDNLQSSASQGSPRPASPRMKKPPSYSPRAPEPGVQVTEEFNIPSPRSRPPKRFDLNDV